MKKILTAVSAIAAATVLFAGCATTDVVQKYSKQSFSDILKADPSLVSDGKNNDYILTVDGKTRLTVSRDYSKSEEDIVLSTPIQPFVNAGLDVSKLSKGYKADGTTLSLVTNFGKGTGKKDTPEQALFESVTADRKALTYHQALDHYGIVLNGGKFEFAKDYTKNDKDIVFAITAKPLRDLGVDVQKVEGWAFKTMKDESGKNVDLLLKPYNLK
ncbi:MAG TPA: hypothetical protein VHP31_09305 [Caproicibacter sp.]|nr:hypothetical protein [Caproicibacter sp.]